MNTSSTSKLPGKTLGNLALAGSVLLHAGFIFIFSSWQWNWEAPQKLLTKTIQVKLVSTPKTQSETDGTKTESITRPSPYRPLADLAASRPHLKARSPRLSAPNSSPVPWTPSRVQPQKTDIRQRPMPSLHILNAGPEPLRARPLTTPDFGVKRKIDSRPTPPLNSFSSPNFTGRMPRATSIDPQRAVSQSRSPSSKLEYQGIAEVGSVAPDVRSASSTDMPSPPVSHRTPAIPETVAALPAGLVALSTSEFSTRSKISALQIKRLPAPGPDSDPNPGKSVDRGALRGRFTGQVRQRIAQARHYPRLARRRGIEGRPVIAFTLDQKGRLTQVDLEQTSGYRLLDEAALEAVHRAQPYPEIPVELETDSFQFKLPISFKLK